MVSLLISPELIEVVAGDKGCPRDGAPGHMKPAHRGPPNLRRGLGDHETVRAAGLGRASQGIAPSQRHEGAG